MSAMSDLDIQVQERLRGEAYLRALAAAARRDRADAERYPAVRLYRLEAAYWSQLLDVIDGNAKPTVDDEFIIRVLRGPIEEKVLAAAKRAQVKADDAAAKARPAMEVV